MKYFSLFILAILFISASYPVHAIEYGGLSIFPNASEIDEKDPLTKAWFIYTLDRGDVKKGKVNIANTGETAVDVHLYPVDAVTTADGAFAPEPEDKQRVDVGAWVSLAPLEAPLLTGLEASELRLGPGETKIIDFTIRVPEDAEVGDHMGAIIVQSKAPPEEMEGSGLRITTRVGARIYITVPGKIVKELAFDEFIQKTQEGAATFYSTFSNKGNVRIRLKGIIEIVNSSGEAVDVVNIPEREVFPQKTITIPTEWHPKNFTPTPKVSVWGRDGEELKARAVVTYGADSPLVRELAISLPFLTKPFMLALVSSSGIAIGISIGFVISIALVGLFYLARPVRNKISNWASRKTKEQDVV